MPGMYVNKYVGITWVWVSFDGILTSLMSFNGYIEFTVNIIQYYYEV